MSGKLLFFKILTGLRIRGQNYLLYYTIYKFILYYKFKGSFIIIIFSDIKDIWTSYFCNAKNGKDFF